jgi:hypothetical protein
VGKLFWLTMDVYCGNEWHASFFLGVKLKFPTSKKFDRRFVDERTVHGYVKVSVACWCFPVQCISSVAVLSQVPACIPFSSFGFIYAGRGVFARARLH